MSVGEIIRYLLNIVLLIYYFYLLIVIKLPVYVFVSLPFSVVRHTSCMLTIIMSKVQQEFLILVWTIFKEEAYLP